MSSAIMITVTTKPADTVWFAAANPEAARRATAFTKNQPGYIGGSVQRIAPNTLQIITIFDTKENLDAFIAATANNPDHQAREAYKTAHGQVTTTTIR